MSAESVFHLNESGKRSCLLLLRAHQRKRKMKDEG